jgi:hypothetical protein
VTFWLLASLFRKTSAFPDDREILGFATILELSTTHMAETDAKAAPAGSAPAGPGKPERPPNPVWRMMGALIVTFSRIAV